MEASPRKHGMYYRCPARTLAPGSPALASHPPAVYLREDPVRDAVNGWLGDLFARENVDRTAAALVGSQGGESSSRESVKARLANAEAKLRRLQAAIEAGVEPAALVESINEAQAHRSALRAELGNVPADGLLSDAEIYARIDALVELGTGLSGASTDRLASFYTAVDLRVCYDHDSRTADVRIKPLMRVNSECVRGGIRTHKPGTSTLIGEITPKTLAESWLHDALSRLLPACPVPTVRSLEHLVWGYIPKLGLNIAQRRSNCRTCRPVSSQQAEAVMTSAGH
jgi:hypothetical protein